MLALFVLFIAELWVMVQVAVRFGVLDTIALLVLMPILGIWLVKRAGLAVFRRLHANLEAGAIPHKEVIDGFLLLFAGLLLIVPGFITGAVGLLLLLPPVRIAVRSMLLRSFKRRGSYAFRIVDNLGRRVDIRDVRSRDVTESPRFPPELEP
ncbi:MAG: protein FxsA [Acidimicrobiaceae bacterium]|jgi:UPF0716 protein FxsA